MLHSSSSRQGKLTSIQFLTFVCIHYRRILKTPTLSRSSGGDGGASRAPALGAAGSSAASQSNESSTFPGSFLFDLHHTAGAAGRGDGVARAGAGGGAGSHPIFLCSLVCAARDQRTCLQVQVRRAWRRRRVRGSGAALQSDGFNCSHY